MFLFSNIRSRRFPKNSETPTPNKTHHDSKKITLLRVIPTMTFQNSHVRFYVSLIGSGEGRHTTHLLKCVLLLSTSQTDWKQSSDILSDISFDILSDKSSDISFDILSDISSDILSDISFDILSTYLLTFFLTYLLTFFLTHLLTFFLTYLLTFFLTYLLTYLLTFFLTYLLTFTTTQIKKTVTFNKTFCSSNSFCLLLVFVWFNKATPTFGKKKSSEFPNLAFLCLRWHYG